MKIKTVEIFGFKSFLEKTSLSFFPGITAMVGPNGCGKSNIVDAIRWALGEQSAKHLRGNLMEDIIFNGSRSKKPLGLAEVSLTFSNENGAVPLQYRNFTEIQITRRVFRSGESEYYINKTPCRLKDITELFMDTGVGTRAYSIIEQGRVETIINSKPIEHRFLIEEAAGISKYKARKQEALRKMDATRQNLLRINDVLGEIGKQISSLKYQTQKLKRFKGLKERIRKLELALASQKYVALGKNQSFKKTELGTLKDKQDLLIAEINSLNAEIVAKKMQLQEEEEKFTTTERKKLEIEYSIKEEENNIERKKEKIGDLEKQSTNASLEMEDNLSRLHLEEEEINKSKSLKNQLQGEIQEVAIHLKGEEEKLSKAKEDFATIRKDLESQKEELFEVRYEISRRENIIDHGEQARNECQRRLEQNREETRTAQAQLEEVKSQKISTLKELEKNRQNKERLEKEQGAYGDTIFQLERELKDTTDVISNAKEEQARFESQLESLLELQKNFEGCSDGVRCIMQKKDGLEKIRNGLYGLVADFIETEPHLEVAVESVLGEKLQYVIVKSHTEGIEAVEYLKAQSLGRGTFIPMETEKELVFEEQKDNGSFHQATPLINMVKVKEGYQPIIRYLLGDTLLVEGFSQALSLWKNSDSQFTLVTLSGEIIDPRGIITGGNQNGNEDGFLRKKRKVKELEYKLSSLAEELFSLQKKKEEKTSELEDNQKSLKDIQERLIQQKLFLQNQERDLQQNTEEIQRVQRKIEFLFLEEKKLTSELEELEEDLEINRAELEELQSKQLLVEETFSVLQQKEIECREKIDSREKSFNQYKVDFMDLKARIASLTSTLELRQKALVNYNAEISKSKKTREEAEKEAVELKETIETALVRVNSMSQSYQRYQDELSEQESKLNEERNHLREYEEKLKAIQQEFNVLQPSIQELDHELTQIISETRYLEDTMGSKYHVSLKEVVNQFPPEDYPEEETRTKLERLEGAQERMIDGINFNAEREYEEQVEKYQFYQTQSEDLNKSLNSLQEAINKINQTSRERFQTTFHKVNENFKVMLPLVFEGGQGELILTDESDLLETGVEIMVQPAGKSLKNINLLSGGEKSLAAISLLFALYLIKPTPFCLLDEVDSPLDDANIDRFIAILKKFAPDSQFVLITHNKKTMEIADTLYGITMEEPGISKIVSVRLN